MSLYLSAKVTRVFSAVRFKLKELSEFVSLIVLVLSAFRLSRSVSPVLRKPTLRTKGLRQDTPKTYGQGKHSYLLDFVFFFRDNEINPVSHSQG